MGIALSEEHLELERAVRRFAEANFPREVMREALEAPRERLGAAWGRLAGQGWLGMAVPVASGGDGFGLVELGIVVEELGRAMAPGPFLPSALVALAMAHGGAEDLWSELMPGLLDGSLPAGLVPAQRGAGGMATTQSRLVCERWPGGGSRGSRPLVVSGVLEVVWGGPLARLILVPVDLAGAQPTGEHDSPGTWGPGAGQPAGRELWCVIDAEACSVAEAESLDPTRRVASIEVSSVEVPESRQLRDLSSELLADLCGALVSAEAVGIARWCVDTAAAHARERVQFGRPIGAFQGVKHRCADMLVALESAVATVADALDALDEHLIGSTHDPGSLHDPGSRTRDPASLSVSLGVSSALGAAVEVAKGAIQVLGGIGFTWEHDAHVYLRRAVASRQLFGPEGPWRQRAASLALAGTRRNLHMRLPEEAEVFRPGIAAELEALACLHGPERRRALAQGGWMVPSWPRPWGRDASALEQLVIEEELDRAKIRRPTLGVGAWALPTLIAHGTESQRERFVGPTLAGEITWCQLFSEPSAGSDLASLATRAERAEGGWELTGQKVWTSMADRADLGICLARTDPTAPRREGISYFVLDMGSPGIDVRPLRELTGEAMFNEVFLDSVFVPEDCLVGELNDGWQIARTTLANERVSLSSGSTFGAGIESLIEVLGAGGQAGIDAARLERLGGLLAEAQALAAMAHRSTARALARSGPGAEASVRKLLGAEHEQRIHEQALEWLGPSGASGLGDAARLARGFLVTRCLTIAGGTSEVQRNVIGERLLGLARDLEPEEPR